MAASGALHLHEVARGKILDPSGVEGLHLLRTILTFHVRCSLNVRRYARGDRHMGTYRMRFLWPDEIDADRAHYETLLERWGSDEAIDDMEHAFGSIVWQMPERVLCVALDAHTDQEALEEAAARWRRHPRLDGRVGYLIFDRRFTDCVIEVCDFRPNPTDASKAA
jgi:hypothetical protein